MLKAKSQLKDAISSEIITISPAQASSWLEDSKFDNRRLDDRNVDRIVRDIKNNRWVFDGNPIRFDKEENIIDGQHRLWAIVFSGKSVQSSVIRGLDSQAKLTIDSGKSRSNADFLHFSGKSNTTILASIARLAIGHKENKGDLWKWAQTTSNKRLTSQELMVEISNNSLLEEAVVATISLRTCKKIFSPATTAFCYYLFSSISKNKNVVDKFFSDLETGNNLLEGNAILALRNVFIIRDIDFKDRQGGNKVIAYKIALITKAWNAWKDNFEVKKFRYDTDKEKYPLPK